MALDQHLSHLRVPHTAVQQAVVASVFAEVSKPGVPPARKDSAIADCLRCGSKAAVESCVLALLQLVTSGSLPATSAQDQLLTALSVAGPSTAPPLTHGLLQLFEIQLRSGPQNAHFGAWRSHPLSRALLASTAAAQPLMLGISRMLARAANGEPAQQQEQQAAFQDLFQALRPFLVHLLLDPQLAAQQPLLALQLHSALTRVACCCSSPLAQHILLQLLVDCLPANHIALAVNGSDVSCCAQQEAAVSAAVADVAEVLENCAEEPATATIALLASHLVQLCLDAARAQKSSLLEQLLAALAYLAGHWPLAVLPHLPDLGVMLLQLPGAVSVLGAAEAKAALALLAQLLQYATETAGAAQYSGSSWQQLAAVLQFPLLQQVTFSNSTDVKRWAGHNLRLLQKLQLSTDNSTTSASAPCSSRPEAAGRGALHVLQSLWARPVAARHWLASLQLTLQRPASSSIGSGSQPVRDQQQLDSSTVLVLCALLQHPVEAVQRGALAAAVAAMAATPLLGLSLLPLLVQQLQHHVELFSSGKQERPSRLLQELLRALSLAGRHPAALPFVLRTLQPLLGPGAPELLQAVALRLLCRLWQSSGGRAYLQLRTTVIGFAAPGTKPGLALRIARAECLRDIAAGDPDKAVELVGLIQDCLGDEAPAVQAAALDCISMLCEADVLEFYAAWRVVHRAMPRLPGHPAAAASWVRLLGYGGLDAAVQPDVAAAIIDALWLAAADESPEVRGQAYASLAAYQFSTLEEISALRPLCTYAAQLHAELQQQAQHEQQLHRSAGRRGRYHLAVEQATAECEALVQAALAHEHATRRRPAGAGAAAGGPSHVRSAGTAGTAAAALSHRLQSVLPKQLLGGMTTTVSDLLQRLPELSPAAVLYLYAPPPPLEGASKAAASTAARQAAADYLAVFAEVVKLQAGAGPSFAEDAVAAAAMLAAWTAFMRRWLAAARAAALSKQPVEQQKATGEAALQVWEAVKQQLGSSSSSPAAAANAAWAAAALCCCTTQPIPQLVTAVHVALREAATVGQWPAAAVRGALAALGAIAEAVRTTLGAPAAQQILSLLKKHLWGPQQPPADASAAVAALTGVGLACRALGTSSAAAADDGGAGQLPVAAEELLQDGLESVISALCALWGAGAGSVQQAAAASGLTLPPVSPAVSASSSKELLPSAALALAVTLPSAASAVELGSILRALQHQLVASLTHRQAGAPDSAPTDAAFCSLLQAATATGLRAGCLSTAESSVSLRQLLSIVGGSSSAEAGPRDGRLAGAAAEAAGTLLSAALHSGFTPGSPEEEPSAVLQSLLALAAAADRLQHAAAGKRGAAAGTAALLSAGAVDPAAPVYKVAVTALEDLALRGSDVRARRACALPLAALCHAARHGGGPAAAAGFTPGGLASASAANKGLSQLATDGALRPLLESLMEGRWVLPEEPDSTPGERQQHQTELSASDAAAILRCLAAAERLPAMNYSALCRRLLRTHSAPAQAAEQVEAAVVSFVAAQGGRQQQQYHLAELAAELLSQRRLADTAPELQRCVLRHLPQLLAGLPEAQAVGALQSVCLYVISASHSGKLLLALLQAAEQLLLSKSSTALQQAALRVVAEILLPALPQPSIYPLRLSAVVDGAIGPGSTQLLSNQQRCWAAMLHCLQRLPKQELESLLQQPLLLQQLPKHTTYATAALVAAGSLDARSLQYPRNLLLEAPGSSSSLSARQQPLVALFVGRAVASLTAAHQQQWLLDILEAVQACKSPHTAFLLAVSILTNMAAAAVDTEQHAADHMLADGTPDAVMRSLPNALRLLLESQAWSHGSTRALLLQRLAAALQSIGRAQPAHDATAAVDSQQLLQTCLLAARHFLPPDMLPLLASLL